MREYINEKFLDHSQLFYHEIYRNFCYNDNNCKNKAGEKVKSKEDKTDKEIKDFIFRKKNEDGTEFLIYDPLSHPPSDGPIKIGMSIQIFGFYEVKNYMTNKCVINC